MGETRSRAWHGVESLARHAEDEDSMTTLVVDPWTAQKQAQYQAALARVGGGVGQTPPSAQTINVVGWGVVALLTTGIYWAMMKGTMAEKNPRRRRVRRNTQGEMAYTSMGTMRVPDVRVTPKSGDQIVLLRGHGHTCAVVRDGKTVGFAVIEDCGEAWDRAKKNYPTHSAVVRNRRRTR
jgi:hypothetical protein